MKIYPGSTLRLSSSQEAMPLEPIQGVASLVLTPRMGEEVVLPVDGTVELPRLAAPNFATMEWVLEDYTATSYLEVVSRHYFEIDQLRNLNMDQDLFSDTEIYPDDVMFMARQAATDIFEQSARRSFVRRIGSYQDFGRDHLITIPEGDVVEVLTEGYEQVSPNQLLSKHLEPRTIEYIYGLDSIPAEVSRAVMELTAFMLRPSNVAANATGESTDAGYIHFTIAGRDGATAIPSVNAAIEQFGRGVQYVW